MLKYTRRIPLKLSTLLCTFDRHNIYTVLPQEEIFNSPINFPYIHGEMKAQGISLDTIRKSAALDIKPPPPVKSHFSSKNSKLR